MRRDKNAPRLYELLGDNPPSPESIRRPRPARTAREPRTEESRTPARGFRDLFTPGRTIQVPAGWAFFAVAFLLTALILGYFAGYTKRGLDARRKAQRQAELTTPADSAGAIRDPLAAPPDAGSDPPTPRQGQDLTPPRAPASRAIIVELGDPDPREPGLNYLVVARLTPDFAARAAEYLTARGVPAARLAPDSKNWCKVVALTGFTAETLRSQEAEDLRAKILDIGHDFKTIEHGGDNFASMYAEKYTGP